MLLTLLIVTQALAEWVEISQQHYRKPIRTYNTYNPFTNTDRIEVEDTTKSWIQNNKTVSEYNWSKAPLRQTNVGNKQVQHPDSVIKSIEADKHVNLDEDEFELRPQLEPTVPTTEFGDNSVPKATIERVSSIGNIKRVQLNNSPVKSPTINIKGDVQLKSKTRYEEFLLNDEQQELKDHKKVLENKINTRRIYVNQIRNRHNTEPTSTFPSDQDEYSFTEEVHVMKNRPKQFFKNRTDAQNIFITKPTFITETQEFIQYAKDEDVFYKDTQSKTAAVTGKKETFTTEPTDTEKNIITDTNKDKQTIEPTYNKNYDTKNADNSVKNRPLHKVTHPELDRNRDDIIDKDGEKNKGNAKSEQDFKSENAINNDEGTLQNKQKKSDALKGTKPENKLKNMEYLLKLMKVVADTISQNTRRSLGGKMRYLQDLKHSLIENIAERIDATWPDDDDTGGHRRSRSVHASPRGQHVQFPSSESALMTISFLTFAVFLIKLVLQIIQTYKNKTMMVAPVMVAAAGRTALAQHGHH